MPFQRRDGELRVGLACGLEERLRERDVLLPLMDRRVGRREARPERRVVSERSLSQEHPRDDVRAADSRAISPPHSRIPERVAVGPEAEHRVVRRRRGVDLVPAVVPEGAGLLRGQLLAQVDLPRSQREDHRGRAFVEGEHCPVERRSTAPVAREADELGSSVRCIALDPEGAGPDHAARNPRARLCRDRGRLDDRLVRRLADEPRDVRRSATSGGTAPCTAPS